MRKILLVSSESIPFIKTRDLADVVGSLPNYINKEEFDIRVFLPCYKVIPEEYKFLMEDIASFNMNLSWKDFDVVVKRYNYKGIIFYFIDNEYYFSGNTPYETLYEDIEKFTFFSKAVLTSLPYIKFKPDIIHCHDWQAGLVPVYLKEEFMNMEYHQDKFYQENLYQDDAYQDNTYQENAYQDNTYQNNVYQDNAYQDNSYQENAYQDNMYQDNLMQCYSYQENFYHNIKTIMTIHNLKLQGKVDTDTVKNITGLPSNIFTSDKLVDYSKTNYLKGGIVYADYITTVSQSYVEDIKTPFFGEGLDGVLRRRKNSITGIVNGIDYNEYNPDSDSYINYHYNITNFKTEKANNKKKLQEELNLNICDKTFMIGIISSLTEQKGFDLIDHVMNEICAEDIQLVVLGMGELKYEELMKHFARKYGDRVSANILYSKELAHKMFASCDALLIPSLFEPCGINQLICLRYGTLPIVRKTGGLCDTVKPYNELDSTGFCFTNYNAHEMLTAIRNAKQLYYNHRDEWNKMIHRAMKEDYSWNRTVHSYEELYSNIINDFESSSKFDHILA